MTLEFLNGFQILAGVLARFWPVWLVLAVLLGLSFAFKRRLGLYGQLFDSYVGIAGVGLCLFWVFTAIFASVISPFDPLAQIAVMKDASPGAIEPASGQAFLFGGDRLGERAECKCRH